MDKNDLHRLFTLRHQILTPDETIDGEPDERLAVMEEFANILHSAAYTILVNCPANAERDLAVRRLHEAMLYADFGYKRHVHRQQNISAHDVCLGLHRVASYKCGISQAQRHLHLLRQYLGFAIHTLLREVQIELFRFAGYRLVKLLS